MKLTLLVAALGCGTLLAGCTTDIPIPNATQAWIHDIDGQVIQFRNNATGATEQVLVDRLEKTESPYSGKLSVRHKRYHHGYLAYFTDGYRKNGLSLAFTDHTISLQFVPGQTDSDITLQTDDNTKSETVAPAAKSSARLHDNIIVSSQTYGRTLEGSLLDSARTPEGLRSFWYTKETGLVAYAKNNGQVWVRLP